MYIQYFLMSDYRYNPLCARAATELVFDIPETQIIDDSFWDLYLVYDDSILFIVVNEDNIMQLLTCDTPIIKEFVSRLIIKGSDLIDRIKI